MFKPYENISKDGLKVINSQCLQKNKDKETSA